MRKMLGLLGLSLILFAGSARVARACSIGPYPGPFVVNTSLQATDHEGPSKPTITGLAVRQAHDASSNDCGDRSTFEVGLGPVTDDQSPKEKIGFELEVVEGSLPSAFTLPDYPVEFWHFSQDSLDWTFGESNEDFSFALRVTAVDEAGNRSVPSDPVFVSGSRSGCSAASAPLPVGDVGGALVTALVAAGLVRRRATGASR